MTDEKVAILGGKGMLGTDVVRACKRHDIKTGVLDLPEFDITNDNDLSNAVKNASIIVNCAAYTNVDKAESEPSAAYTVNADAVGKLGVLARAADIPVIHISTDFVFDGRTDKPYTEEDDTKAINVYGKSKLTGEQLLIESGCQYCIIRVEWTYGIAGNNFIKKLLSLAEQKETLTIVDDQIGSPTATVDVAEVICQFIKDRRQGLFHFASAGFASRFEMAKFIAEKLNLTVEIKSCKSSKYKTAAKRPLNSRFDCSKIQQLLPVPIKPWQQSLERFLEQL